MERELYTGSSDIDLTNLSNADIGIDNGRISVSVGKDDLIRILTMFAKEHPNEIIHVEYPVNEVYELKDGSTTHVGSRCAHLKLGEALIYEGFNGEIVIDTE